jgi:hypothetical protein
MEVLRFRNAVIVCNQDADISQAQTGHARQNRSVGCIGPRVYEIQTTDYGTACRCSSIESCGLEYEIRDLAWMGNQRYVAGIK